MITDQKLINVVVALGGIKPGDKILITAPGMCALQAWHDNAIVKVVRMRDNQDRGDPEFPGEMDRIPVFTDKNGVDWFVWSRQCIAGWEPAEGHDN